MTGYSGRNADKLIRIDWYPGDYLSDPKVLVMTPLQELAYFRLLNFQARGGPLTSVPEHLAVLARCTPADFEASIWPGIRSCFVEEGGKVWNERMEREREVARLKFSVASEAGRRGNEIRWGKSGRDREAIGLRSEPDRQQQQQQQQVGGPPRSEPVSKSKATLSGTGGVAEPATPSPGPDRVVSVSEADQPQAPEPIGSPRIDRSPVAAQASKKRPALVSEATGALPGCPEAPEEHRFDPKDLACLWAELCPELPQPQTPLASGVRDALRKAIKRERNRDWRATFERVGASDKLNGRSFDWACPGILWAVGPKNLAALDAGQHDNRVNHPKQRGRLADMDDAAERVAQKYGATLKPNGARAHEPYPEIERQPHYDDDESQPF